MNAEDESAGTADTGAEPRLLPTEPGSVIGWSTWYDGPVYGSAVLEYDADDSGDLVWYRAGFSPTWTSDEMFERVGEFWQDMGQIVNARNPRLTSLEPTRVTVDARPRTEGPTS